MPVCMLVGYWVTVVGKELFCLVSGLSGGELTGGHLLMLPLCRAL